MSVLVFALVGLLVGAGYERLFHRFRPGRVIAVSVVIFVLVIPTATVAGAWWLFSRIDRVETEGTLSSGNTNFLLVGSDAREGVDGNRSDTIIVLHVEAGSTKLLSIPRDLLVTVPGRDGESRINAAYNDGPPTLIQTVEESLGIPIHRYVEVDFASFADVVDALGGVTITFDNPSFDSRSGLELKPAGPVELDGDQALAYVRSRTFTEVVDGEQRVDPTGDLGRVLRQQKFLQAVLTETKGSYNPLTLARLGGALGGGVRIDDEMNLLDALGFAWRLRGLNPEPLVLPVDPVTLDNGAQVLQLRDGEAEPVLTQLR